MKCLFLGAGYATRLYPLTRERPKPLLPVGGVPMLQRLIEKVLLLPSVDRIFIVTNHRFVGHYYAWLRNFQEWRKPTVPIEVFDDMTASNDDRLGAVGDMHFVVQNAKVDDDLLVIGGDNLFEFNLADLLTFTKKHGSTVAVKDLAAKKHLVSHYGAVEVDDQQRIIDFEEKPPVPRTTLVALALYSFTRKHVPLFKRYLDEGHNMDAPGYYITWLHKQVPLYAYPIEGDWFDIGDIDSYNRANEVYLGR